MNLDEYEDIDPGIRDAVRTINAMGFTTTDSGDGTADMECAIGFPHVFIAADSDLTISADCELLQEAFPNARIEASYSPGEPWVIGVMWPPPLATQLSLNEYQRGTNRTATGESRAERAFLGIAGEAGEVCEVRKKYLRGDYGSDKYIRRLRGELGGLLWYVAQCCELHGLSLGDVAEDNLRELESRQERSVISGDGSDR